MKKKSFLSELLQRFNQETPEFFKTVTKIGVTLLAIGAIPKSAELVELQLSLPAIVTTVCNHIAVAGGVIIAVAQAACKNFNPEP